MDGFDEEDNSNIWARQSPEQAQSQPNHKQNYVPEAINAGAGGTATSNSFNADKHAWDIASDDEDEDDNDEQFVEATSRLDFSNSGIGNKEEYPEFESESMPTNVAGPSSPPRTIAQPPPLSQVLPASFEDFDSDDGFEETGPQKTTTILNESNDANDDDEFGAFDETDTAADFGDFNNETFGESVGVEGQAESSSALPLTTPSEHGPQPPLSVPSSIGIIDFASIGTDAESTRPHILNFFKTAWPDLMDQVDHSIPERQLEGRANILYSKELKDAFYELVEKDIEYVPFDWKRSQIRRNMMQKLGVPVDLDDVTPAVNPLPSLVLPSIRTTPASPSPNTSVSAKKPFSTSAPVSASLRANGLHSSTSRSASPSPTRHQSSLPTIQPIDLDACRILIELKEEDMSIQTLTELDVLRTQMQDIAIHASTHLTTLLERKETLMGQSGTYNAMIQDLVRKAQKIRSSGSPTISSTVRKTSVQRSNSGSTKGRTSLSSNSTAVPSSGPSVGSGNGSGTRSLFGSSSSRPNSRPGSPAPTSGTGQGSNVLKSSLGRSSAAGEAPAAVNTQQLRRSSLW